MKYMSRIKDECKMIPNKEFIIEPLRGLNSKHGTSRFIPMMVLTLDYDEKG